VRALGRCGGGVNGRDEKEGQSDDELGPRERHRRGQPPVADNSLHILERMIMKHIKTTLMQVHPEQAERWLMQNNFLRQRPLRGWHVKYLAQAMKADRFLEGTQIHSLNF
jgi:hypothetical protein